jgi:hypothetical protein
VCESDRPDLLAEYAGLGRFHLRLGLPPGLLLGRARERDGLLRQMSRDI